MVQGDKVDAPSVSGDGREDTKDVGAALDSCLNILIDRTSDDRDITSVCSKLSAMATRCSESDIEIFRRLGGITALSRVLKRPDLDSDMAEAAAAALTKLSLPLTRRPESRTLEFNRHSITIRELEYCETGTAYNLWTAALVMCSWAVENNELKAELEGGRRVLELGSGLGLVGSLLSKMGGDVTFSDFVPKVLENLEETVMVNKLRGRVVSLNWEKEAETRGKEASSASWYGGCVDEGEITRFAHLDEGEMFDVIVGTDICYESDHPEVQSYHLLLCVRPEGGERG